MQELSDEQISLLESIADNPHTLSDVRQAIRTALYNLYDLQGLLGSGVALKRKVALLENQ